MPRVYSRVYIGDSDLGTGEQSQQAKIEEMNRYTEKASDQQNKLLNETVERNDLSETELEDFLWENYQDEDSKEYLVNRAILTCTNCTSKDVYYKGQQYKCPVNKDKRIGRDVDVTKYADKVLKRLVVTENPTSEVNGLHFATTADVVRGQNIPFFGNCDLLPDNDAEIQAFQRHPGQYYNEGTCKLLMNLEGTWENYDLGQTFLEFPDDDNKDKTGITMTSMLFCKHGGFVYPVTSGQTKYANYSEAFTYIDKDGNVVTRKWTISNEEFLDYNALTLEEIEIICNYHNPELVKRGFAEGIYKYCITNKLNPKVLLATLGQEQGWCKSGNYNKAFGVGPGGNPRNFSNSKSGIGASGQTFIKLYNEGLNAQSLILTKINRDAAPNYSETKAQCGSDFAAWQSANPNYVVYMENGQDIECVNAVMYAKLRYTPWVDFPPAGSHPLEDWLRIYKSLEECISYE